MYKYLLANDTCNRILGGKLRKEEYSNKDVFDFLTILQKISNNSRYYQLINHKEWIAVVK